MSEGNFLSPFKKATRVALPSDDTYLYRLGVATYGFAYVTSFVAENVCHLDSTADRTALGELTAGAVLDRFRQVAKAWSGASIQPHASQAADVFEGLNTQRNDFIHAYPVTNRAGEQILHRRLAVKDKYFEVTSSFLDDFIARLEVVIDDLYAIRAVARPDL